MPKQPEQQTGPRQSALVLTALILVYFTLSIALVAHTYRHPSDARQRTQTKFWLLAIAVSGPFDLTNLLPVYGINVYPLGSFGNALYLGVIAYAIARHRLMDVDYVVRKAVSFFLAASAVLVPGGLVVFMLGRAVGAEQAVVVACAAVALALLSVVLIPIFQEALETRVHRAFFRKLCLKAPCRRDVHRTPYQFAEGSEFQMPLAG